jgi:6-pyruvoyl tetrahydropterin synthase/QueD family protein
VSLKIMRRVTFCAGHRLLGHDGKCKNLHGHNYVAEFHVTGQQQDEIGRIIDFKLLKDKCKGWLDEHWDHAFLLWERDENARGSLPEVAGRYRRGRSPNRDLGIRRELRRGVDRRPDGECGFGQVRSSFRLNTHSQA